MITTLLRNGIHAFKNGYRCGFILSKTPSSASHVTTRTEVTTTSQLKSGRRDDDQAQEPCLSFDDPHAVFKHKTTWEIFRALLVLKLCSYNVVVNNCEKCLTVGHKLLGERFFSALLKPVVYKQFVAGNSKQDVQNCVTELRKAGIGTLISVPLEEDTCEGMKEDDHYGSNLQKTLSSINMAAEVETKCPMVNLRLSGLLPADICAKLSELFPEPSQNPELVKAVAVAMESGKQMHSIPNLSDVEHDQLMKGLAQLKAIGQLGVERNVIVMVDAECTYINPALSLFTLAMMLNYNKEIAIIFNTYQNYLMTTSERLRRHIQFIDECGVCFGVKLVRGAYIYRERRRAVEMGYPDPVHPTFEDTTTMYNDSLDLMLSQMSRNPRTRMIIATHNQQTVEQALQGLRYHRVDPTTGNLFFGQVMGIGDHVSFQLGALGAPVYKAVPIGSLFETLPYLSRRVQESRSILEGTRQERMLLKTALKGRLFGT